jgi:uncharacterized protein
MTARLCLAVWCVSDGRAGIERQTLAVADALAEVADVDRTVIRLTPRGPQVLLPPILWPNPLEALPDDQRAVLTPPWPDVWIGNGRRAIAYTLGIKRWGAQRTLTVQLQDPKVDLARFDLVVPPQHDRLVGPNVIATFGAPVWHSASVIEAARRSVPMPANPDGQNVLVILGGTSKAHRFTEDRAQTLMDDLRRLHGQGHRLFITTSRRTPTAIITMTRATANDIGAGFFADEAHDGANPYLSWLSQADVAMVTEDSTNMITDAAFFGLPVHLIRLDGGAAKFDRFHAALLHQKAACWFDGRVSHWPTAPIRDAAIIADAIVRRILERSA